jgi:hypothetical protein
MGHGHREGDGSSCKLDAGRAHRKNAIGGKLGAIICPDFNSAWAAVGDSLTRPIERHRMRINEAAVSFAAFSLTKILVAVLMRK